jgi:N-methylhydantoinase A
MTDTQPRPRIAVDVGGTFTDVALEASGKRFTTKLLTTPSAPAEAVLRGIACVLGLAHVEPRSVAMVVHGTTLGTNALIERKGARTALITTEGFRDVVEIRHENRFEQYDVNVDLPQPLVPRRLRYPVRERIDAHGNVLVALAEEDVAHAIDCLARERVQSVAVGFLHSFINPAHEQRARELLERRLPGVPVSLSCEVSPEMREYERFSTACANAYLQPLMSHYLKRLAEGLAADGFRCPLFLILSGGGIATVETAIRFPVRLVESGPAGGAIFASHIAAQCGLEKIISFDMGGTTAKICLIDDATPQTNRAFEVARVYRFKKGSGLPLRIPVIEMVEIGAGGGSIASIDALGRIAVGPESAGSEPGPACYGRGGADPTVTDADVLLGRIDPAGFSGGRFRLDRAKAEAAVGKGIGAALHLPLGLAALGISEMVDENMANAARVHTIESGKNVGDRTLVAFGGAAPVHAARVAEKLAIDRVLIPSDAGVGSAVGFLRSPVAYEIVRTDLQRLSKFDPECANGLLAAMRAEAEGIVRQAAGEAPLVERRSAFMRYRGQGHEISVPLDARRYTGEDARVLRNAFEDRYRRLYSRIVPGVDIEVLSWVLELRAPLEPWNEPEIEATSEPAKPCGRRPLCDPATGQLVEVPLYRRADLRPGMEVRGPAVIAEDDTSIVVAPRFEASMNRFGHVELVRRV